MDPYIARLFQIESGGNPNAVTGSNRGLGQFGPAEEAQFGLNDQNRTDPNAQAAAVQREAALHTGVLGKALGREPTPGELYLAHQQGIAGGPALLTGGGTPAWQAIRPYYKSDAMAQKAISGNLPAGSGIDPATATADQFSRFWVSKFEGGKSQAPAPFQAIPPGTAPNLPLFGAQQEDFPRPSFEPAPGLGASFNGPISSNIEDRRMWGGARAPFFNYDSLSVRNPYPFHSQGASPAGTIDNFNTSRQGVDVSPMVPTPITPSAPPLPLFGSHAPQLSSHAPPAANPVASFFASLPATPAPGPLPMFPQQQRPNVDMSALQAFLQNFKQQSGAM